MQLQEALRDNTPHLCTSESCPASGSYYVTAVDYGRVFYMSGPYPTHAQALLDVDKALKIANEHEGKAWFMAWGTSRRTDGYSEPGTLNKYGLLTISADPFATAEPCWRTK